MASEISGRDPALARVVKRLQALDAELTDVAIARHGESKDQALAGLMRKRAQALFRHGRGDGELRLVILADAKSAGILSLPAGTILMTEKFARSLKDGNELAAVLGHEIGHLRGRHLVFRLKTDAATAEWLDAKENGRPGGGATGRILDRIIALRFNEQEEAAAEAIATRILSEAGYDPKLALAAHGVMHRTGTKEMLAAHPGTAEPGKAMNEEIRKMARQWEFTLERKAVDLIIRQLGGNADRGATARVHNVDLMQQVTVFAIDGAGELYSFSIHVAADTGTINTFMLPNGNIIIPAGLLNQLRNDVEVAAVLRHMVGHVLARHGAAQLEKLAQGPQVLAGNDPRPARIAKFASDMKFTREEELEADRHAARVLLYGVADKDPRPLAKTMDRLTKVVPGSTPSAFASAHPDPGKRLEVMQAEIERVKDLTAKSMNRK